ncbi:MULTISPECIES: hypothetical protein [Capnocytophaga]|uniref:Uncharacterized protein n=1 Tax=Capnocytophaga canis TaxID=1848903 RepID=A0A0B7I8X6_9FLAO|nr:MULTISPECIES: hypothetical protein [Capnocytophaga]ATA73464.1 hypothetical protein CGC49_09365 [Capnocytophaga sp. H4358]ATA75604.1 hypothetical protein CGC52_09355 [Capnocytophaga sp. H2931]RIY38007.1 hypothetical protein CKY20_00205 [Capnocytophaga canis]CEN44532.1 conserved hypothetical protein [Capnocytophaga canis]CEN48155.1 conserved hypothetical protein [Capnocytophaga canis]
MPRVYYRDRKINGKPFKNEKITLPLFDYILSKTTFIPDDGMHIFELPQKTSILPWKRNEKGFKYAVVWNNDRIHQTHEYGDFYLPKSIVFFDVKDAYFPSEYFFIVEINRQLEISHCRAGIDTTWFQQPELRRDITDSKIVKRIEKSVIELQMILNNM